MRPRCPWLSLLLLLAACSSYDSGLLSSTSERDAGTLDGGQTGVQPDAAVGGSGDQAGGAAGMGGMGGTGGGTPTEGCRPNPDTRNEVCPEICPERCNDADDDCDRKIDEDEASDDCVRPHTQAQCVRGEGCVVTGCSDGYRDCDEAGDNGCEIAPDDPDHCGQCGHACSVLHGTGSCFEGACVRASCEPGYADCDSDALTCEKLTNTLDDCGGCGVVCANVPNATPSCVSGVCDVESCLLGFGDCADAEPGCERSLNTLSDCGACGVTCNLVGSTDECIDGKCFAQVDGCETGYGECDGQRDNGCEPLSTDENCGACGALCDTSLPHSVAPTACDAAGTCDLHCEPGYGDCDADAQNGCETQLNTLGHCGACGAVCSRPNAVAACATGTCAVLQCDSGYGDCSGGDADGCETPTNTVTNCGLCGLACNADQTCSGGSCSDVNCNLPPYDDDCGSGAGRDCGNCDNDTTCETDLASDLSNCGACGNACTVSVAPSELHGSIGCTPQGCKASCAPDYADCDGDYRNGCEQSLKTLAHCGACGQTCAVANATATCATGSCEVQSCNVDWGDCDADKKSCESQLNSPSKCGACGSVCSLANAVEGCGGTPGARVCTVTACEQSYFRNCDGMAGNGCEIDTRSDKLNCGACGTACEALPNVATASCSASACVIGACDPGFGDCSAVAGCETPLDTVASCGACGNNCGTTLVNTATTTCDAATLTCRIGSCDPGFANCDSTHATGCEVSTTTAQNCGACGNDCTALPHVATASCSAGTTCQITGCQTDWADCDGSTANGCERDVRAPASGGLGPCLPDTGCVKHVSGEREYYFCPMARSWTDARARCQLQRYGDLVHIGDGTENAFVLARLSATQTWIGSNDNLVEGLWLWADNGVPFWRGTSAANGGVALDGLYANWASGEPNASGDCGHIYMVDGKHDDTVCTNTKSFVCEVGPDACPSDPTKFDPGQCGCGTADVDADLDGYAACKDSCPSDAGKLAPGVCGCGVADTNLDGDSALDCVETCDSDPNKLEPGVCGCGTADIDSDGDTFADCLEQCDSDPMKQDPGVCGCGVADANTDGDAELDCNETCDSDPNKLAPGQCGCGNPDTNSDGDAQADCLDGCDNDPNKLVPGACGCGVPDTNTDGDSQPDCNETCDADPNKLVPGACGCGVPDTNTDGDSQPDCNETCDSDPSKLSPGVCGCGVADTDTDSDGTPNCNDGCDADPTTASACFPFPQSNFDPNAINFSTQPSSTLNCGTTTINTSNAVGSMISGWCGTAPTPIIQTQATSGGPQIVVIGLSGLTIASGATLRLVGNKPVVLAVRGDVSVAGIVDANASGSTPGAGGNVSCGISAGGNGSGSSSSGGGGGGGGSFGTRGGSGGTGDGAAAGGSGVARGVPTLEPLIAGCSGGTGGGCGTAATGAGGGGVHIAASGTLTVTGTIRANGSAGAAGCGPEGGGSGGGSGGAILLEANAVNATGATLQVNGGSGGAGSSGGAGGGGSTSNAITGSNGGSDGANGGGGGGGGYGRVRAVAVSTCTACPAPPAPDTSCTYRTSPAARGYYFCTNAASWTAARDNCRNKSGMSLVRIDDATENAYVDSFITATSWIGANDRSAEGAWRWAEGGVDDGQQFWQGVGSAAGGAAVSGQYSAWNGNGEPNDWGGNEDCAELSTSATWNDSACTNAIAWVCEASVSP